MRTAIWTTALVLLGGVAVAAPPMDAPLPEPRFERPTSREAWVPYEAGTLLEWAPRFGMEVADEEIEVARKSRSRKGGGRGGARSSSRGGFSKGNARSSRRGGAGGPGMRSGRRGGDRDVNIDSDVNVDVDDLDDAYTSDDEKIGAALVGGVIGLGVGRMISESEDPAY